MGMSEAIGNMAAVFSNDSQQSGESEQSRLGRAVAALAKEEGLTTVNRARLMIMAQKDIGFADLILSVDDSATRNAIYDLQLQ